MSPTAIASVLLDQTSHRFVRISYRVFVYSYRNYVLKVLYLLMTMSSMGVIRGAPNLEGPLKMEPNLVSFVLTKLHAITNVVCFEVSFI